MKKAFFDNRISLTQKNVFPFPVEDGNVAAFDLKIGSSYPSFRGELPKAPRKGGTYHGRLHQHPGRKAH